jgi:hypothetical protein
MTIGSMRGDDVIHRARTAIEYSRQLTRRVGVRCLARSLDLLMASEERLDTSSERLTEGPCTPAPGAGAPVLPEDALSA